jgi:hypothetical protein
VIEGQTVAIYSQCADRIEANNDRVRVTVSQARQEDNRVRLPLIEHCTRSGHGVAAMRYNRFAVARYSASPISAGGE